MWPFTKKKLNGKDTKVEQIDEPSIKTEEPTQSCDMPKEILSGRSVTEDLEINGEELRVTIDKRRKSYLDLITQLESFKIEAVSLINTNSSYESGVKK